MSVGSLWGKAILLVRVGYRFASKIATFEIGGTHGGRVGATPLHNHGGGLHAFPPNAAVLNATWAKPGTGAGLPFWPSIGLCAKRSPLW